MRVLFYILIFVQLISFTFTINSQTYNPIPVIFPTIDEKYNAQSYGFGQITSVSGSYYSQTSLNGNPAMLANRNINRGFFFTGPLLLDNLVLFDANIIFSNHPKNYFAFHSDYIRYHETFNEIYNQLTIKTMYIFSISTQSFTYGRSVNKNLSWGIGINFFRPVTATGILGKDPVLIAENNIFSLDLGIDYNKPFTIFKNQFDCECGLYISNIGSRVDSIIHEDYPKAFLPTKLHFGNLLKYQSQTINKSNLNIMLAYQIEKLLVPSPPQVIYSPGGERIIVNGKDPDVSFVKGVFQSFYDAPDGFNEEISEYVHKFGMELRLTYDNIFQMALRIGGVYESETKGEDSFFTLGIRAGFYGFYFDYAKIPGYSNEYMRFNLGYVTSIPDFKLRFVD